MLFFLFACGELVFNGVTTTPAGTAQITDGLRVSYARDKSHDFLPEQLLKVSSHIASRSHDCLPMGGALGFGYGHRTPYR